MVLMRACFAFFVVFTAVAVGLVIKYLDTLNDEGTKCNDPNISIPRWNDKKKNSDEPRDDFASINPCRVFHHTYWEARESFRRAARRVVGERNLITLDVVKEKDYTIDIAVLPGSQPGVTVHSSGVHGIEGFAGSAVQLAFLETLSSSASSSSSSNYDMFPTVVLIHVVNPAGMALYRRVNENNVDLNRNGLTEEEWKELKANHYTHNRDQYELFDRLWNVDHAMTSVLEVYVTIWFRVAYYLVLYGYHNLKSSLVSGQYYKPKGLGYGGTEKCERSIQLLREWIENDLHGKYLSDASTSESRPSVTWIDLHTGLGKAGVDTMIPEMDMNILESSEENSSLLTEIGQEISRWFPESRNPLDPSNPDAVQVVRGYEKTRGLTMNYFAKFFSPSSHHNPMFFTQEFGTVPSVQVAHALVVENSAYHHLSAAEAMVVAKRTCKRAFYPQSESWRKSILERGVRVLHQAIQRSMELSATKTSVADEHIAAE